MIVEVLKTLFILAIAIPFVYIVSASVIDILKKIYDFYKLKTNRFWLELTIAPISIQSSCSCCSCCP